MPEAEAKEKTYSALEGGAASDGTLNRFLIIEGGKRAAEVEPAHDPHLVPSSIINDIALVFRRSGELASATRNDPNANPTDQGRLTKITSQSY